MPASVHQISNGTGLAQAPPPRVAVANVDRAVARDALLALSQSRIYARLLSAPIDALPQRISDAGVDVLVLVGDIERPATAKLLRRVRREVPSVRVVLASLDRSGNGARRALNLGADGFVQLPAVDALEGTVRAVHSGQVCVPRHARRTIATPSFSHREKEILALMTQGSTNQEIAARLYLTESTVKSHLATAFEKLGVRSRKEAAALLLDPGERLQAAALPSELTITPLVLHRGGAR